MNILTIKKYLSNYYYELDKYKTAKRYYNNENDILHIKNPQNIAENHLELNPFRNADNRISHNWFNLLVNQKASYMFTYEPMICIKDEDISKKIKYALGDRFSKVLKDLCIEASLFGRAYLHFWKEDRLLYTTVDASQIIPIYSESLKDELLALVRIYEAFDGDKNIEIIEYFDDKCVYSYKKDGEITENLIFDGKNFYEHNLGVVPFIEFSNNAQKTSDLKDVKALIDVYDKVFSGFVNDIEDIQQVILVLTNYGGEDLQTFLRDLKAYKAIDIQSDDANSGLKTMSIDIPIEARCEILKMTRKQIFTSGSGVDPEQDRIGIASGISIKYLYSLLELKCGLLETEFRMSINKFIRCILKDLGVLEHIDIEQIFERTSIECDAEKAEVLYKIKDFTSKKTLAKNNPYVTDFLDEIENLEKEGKNNER